MKLANRLQFIADVLPKKYERLIDVGCDHAKLAIHEVLEAKAQKVLAIDCAIKPLQRAKANVEALDYDARQLCQNRITFKLAYGLEDVQATEKDLIVIAGMGGLEICDVLETGLSCSPQFFVLQAMKSIEFLRLYLALNSYEIINKFVWDKNRLYSIILCKKNHGQLLKYSKLSLLMDGRKAGEHEKLIELRKLCSYSLSDLIFGQDIMNSLNNKLMTGVDIEKPLAMYLKHRVDIYKKLLEHKACLLAVGDMALLENELSEIFNCLA